MHCPNDGATLQMTSREGIEIDYCPECRGVWLDRGELDKLIERGSQPAAPIHRRDDDDRHYQERHHDDDRRHESHHYDNDHHKKHKKESFLGDMFDF